MADSKESIIDLETGFRKVNDEGIQVCFLWCTLHIPSIVYLQPFIRLVEKQERDFFKAKEFVGLYE